MARRSAKRIVLDQLVMEYANCCMMAWQWRKAKEENPIYSDTVKEAETRWYISGGICGALQTTAEKLGATNAEIDQAHTDGDIIFVARLARVEK